MRIFAAAGAIIVVAAIVLTFVLIKLNAKTTTTGSPSNGHTGAVPTAVVDKVTSVSARTLNTVGSGAFTGRIQAITGNPAPLTATGKPELLYIGAEFCPYCAAERWAMIVALSRFGTFSGLATVQSAVSDGAGNQEPYPDTPTWTFAHAGYSSLYLTFGEVELYTNTPDTSTGGYTALQTPHLGRAGPAAQVRRPALCRRGRRRVDTVPRFRQRVREHRGQLQPTGPVRAELEHDCDRPGQPGQYGGQVRGRDGELHHGRDLLDDE